MDETDTKYQKLYRLATCSNITEQLLTQIIDIGDEELLSAAVSNSNCTEFVLDRLSRYKFKKVNPSLLSQFYFFPKLYSIYFREITEADTEYVYYLRTSENYNEHISTVSSDVEVQRKYIVSYLRGNSYKRSSYYLIILNKETGLRCGTVRIYNFDTDYFEWGSWILDCNKSRSAAMETSIFVYEYAFNVLGFSRSKFEVNKNNEKVVRFHLKSGAQITDESKINYYFQISNNQGLAFAKSLRQRLEKKFKQNLFKE